MTIFEIAEMLNITVDDAAALIEACDELDAQTGMVYPEEKDDRGFEDLVAESQWTFEVEEED